MHCFEKYYNNTIKNDLIAKFRYKSLKSVPKLEKIILNFGCKTSDLKTLSIALLALELVANKKGKLTTSSKSSISLKIRKGNPVGCKVIVKNYLMYKIFALLILDILPRLKSEARLKTTKNTLTYNLKNILLLKKIEKNYVLFNNTQNINVVIITSSNNSKELSFLLNCFNFIN